MFFDSQTLTGEKHEKYECQAFAKVWLAEPVEGFSERSTDIYLHIYIYIDI